MPDFPKDWLGWLTLIGSIAGLLAACKLFFENIWFNSFQRHVLIAVEQSVEKTVMTLRRYGGGIDFFVGSKDSDMNSGSKNNDSYANLLYLKELRKRGYFTFHAEIEDWSGLKTKTETFTITAKGIRVARFFKTIRLFYLKIKK